MKTVKTIYRRFKLYKCQVTTIETAANWTSGTDLYLDYIQFQNKILIKVHSKSSASDVFWLLVVFQEKYFSWQFGNMLIWNHFLKQTKYQATFSDEAIHIFTMLARFSRYSWRMRSLLRLIVYCFSAGINIMRRDSGLS